MARRLARPFGSLPARVGRTARFVRVRPGRSLRSEDDDRHSSRGGRSSSMNRNGGGGRRTGGWFGDSEGHSEPRVGAGRIRITAIQVGTVIARVIHRPRVGAGQNPDHGDSGWYGDREGHSQASRRGWENPNHGDSGWFGDRKDIRKHRVAVGARVATRTTTMMIAAGPRDAVATDLTA